jgi:hypothetical protein
MKIKKQIEEVLWKYFYRVDGHDDSECWYGLREHEIHLLVDDLTKVFLSNQQDASKEKERGLLEYIMREMAKTAIEKKDFSGYMWFWHDEPKRWQRKARKIMFEELIAYELRHHRTNYARHG